MTGENELWELAWTLSKNKNDLWEKYCAEKADHMETKRELELLKKTISEGRRQKNPSLWSRVFCKNCLIVFYLG